MSNVGPSERRPIARPEALAVALDAVCQGAVGRRGAPGHVLAGVWTLDGSFQWQGSAAPHEPAPALSAHYRIASVSKLFTATLVMTLVEEGLLGLTTPVVALLPELAGTGLHRWRGRDFTDDLTLAHLLGHTSGLADYFEGRPRGGRSIMDRIYGGEDVNYDLDEVLRIVREDLSPAGPPLPADAQGRSVRYSDTNYQLLGAVVARVTGQSFAEALQRRLLEPLGLQDTWVVTAEGSDGNPTPIYTGQRLLDLSQALRSEGPSGGMVSTLADQRTFLVALGRGAVFRSPETWARMTGAMNRIWFPLQMGLGVMRIPRSRLLSPYRPAPDLLGHSGSTGSWAYLCPTLGAAFAGTVDRTRPRALPVQVLLRMTRLVDAAQRA